jgi:hypothetical protein
MRNFSVAVAVILISISALAVNPSFGQNWRAKALVYVGAAIAGLYYSTQGAQAQPKKTYNLYYTPETYLGPRTCIELNPGLCTPCDYDGVSICKVKNLPPLKLVAQ